jgi:hypothetical protein
LSSTSSWWRPGDKGRAQFGQRGSDVPFDSIRLAHEGQAHRVELADGCAALATALEDSGNAVRSFVITLCENLAPLGHRPSPMESIQIRAAQ